MVWTVRWLKCTVDTFQLRVSGVGWIQLQNIAVLVQLGRTGCCGPGIFLVFINNRNKQKIKTYLKY